MRHCPGADADQFVHFATTLPLFSGLDSWQIRLIYNDTQLITYTCDEVIVHKEDSCEDTGFYLIHSGRAKAYSIDNEGEQIYAVLGRGDFFGEMAIIEDKRRSASVAAVEHCRIFTWTSASFLRMLRSYPSVSLEFMRILSSRLRRANERINNFSFMTARERLIVYLREEVRRSGVCQKDGSWLLESLPSQRSVGAVIGNSRETVSRIFARLAEEGIIERIGYKKVVVHNEKLLQI
ncbi:MAG: Crp/Fnr family transcriptional regulator [Fibrobacterota bacterium]